LNACPWRGAERGKNSLKGPAKNGLEAPPGKLPAKGTETSREKLSNVNSTISCPARPYLYPGGKNWHWKRQILGTGRGSLYILSSRMKDVNIRPGEHVTERVNEAG